MNKSTLNCHYLITEQNLGNPFVIFKALSPLPLDFLSISFFFFYYFVLENFDSNYLFRRRHSEIYAIISVRLLITKSLSKNSVNKEQPKISTNQ